MKKNIIILSLSLLVIIIVCVTSISLNSKQSILVKKLNKGYEQYLEKEIYGTDVITLINKATNNNKSNNVEEDEKGFYINNKQTSITIDLIMITNEEKQKTTTYKMESISKVGMTEFIKNFNTAKFKCTKVEYHSDTGQIAHIEITQQTV